jgi:signal transduction histidine kinase
MDAQRLNALYELFHNSSRGPDWKATLESLAGELRNFIVFDNLAVYLVDPASRGLEVTYARALGRGRSAEADAAWGDKIAAEVIASGQILHQLPTPSNKPNTGRLGQVHLLGLPLRLETGVKGAVVFVRFGGPEFSEEHLHIAALAAMWMTLLFEQRQWLETYQQLEEVQARIRLQDDFLATISHELRTPLGFIKGYSTTLLRQDTSWDATTQREFLTIIEEEADRLAQLIEDLLESARLQSNTLQFKFQPLRLDAMIRDVVLRTRQRHPGLSVNLDFGPVPPLHGDNIHLVRVFENLFSNAIKYAPGSTLNVSLQRNGNMLLFRLTDQGPGIPEEHLPMIFERFYRVPGDGSANTGTGLGLYICKQIVLAHRGKIWAESKLHEGTTFFIELPIDAPPQT